jgi:hypothetical protein
MTMPFASLFFSPLAVTKARQIWVIPETNEVLLDYEAYLHRQVFAIKL